LLPTAPRYSLSALAAQLGVENKGAHRALSDAQMTAGVFEALMRRAMEIPMAVLAEIVRLGKQTQWDGSYFFELMFQERIHESAKSKEDFSHTAIEQSVLNSFSDPNSQNELPPLRPRQKVEPIDVDAGVGLIEEGGALAQRFPGYESREQQRELLRLIGDAFNRGKHIMVEAPTGVGKSLAYLIPAALFALRNTDRVVISTNTLTLQDQLVNKDIPLLASALDQSVSAAVLKGRSNYLCPRRLIAMRRRGPTSADEMQILARVLTWLVENQSGDRGELSLRGANESAVWNRLSAEDEGCRTERCATQMAGVCPFYKAHRRAENAHLVIVNHALLLADSASEGRVLPDYKYLIIDEAHHLESATTNGLSFRTDLYNIEKQVAALGNQSSGLFGELLRQTQGAIPSGYSETLRDFVNTVTDASTYLAQHADRYFKAIQQFIEAHVQLSKNDYAQQVRIVDSMRRQSAWREVELHWNNLSQFTVAVADALSQLAKALTELSDFEIEEFDDLQAAILASSRHFNELHTKLGEIVDNPDSNTIYWVEFQQGQERISFHTAPLDIGPLITKHLWNAKDTIVLLSATLRTGGSFDFVRERLDADHVDASAVGSPFNYKSSTLLYLVNDIPEPGEYRAYQKSLETGVLNLCKATNGRALILFTSFAQLRETTNAIAEPLSREGIVVYDQTSGNSKHHLLEGFIQSPKAVLMGTRSFWEGIDIPGTDLSVLVIARLPFSVPGDPLFAARSEQFADPFMQYALPDAILRFRQGFGRLIRRQDDKGMVVIMDRRILSKRYGQVFLDSLPECNQVTGSLEALPAAARKWLGQE
jgi:DNA polymerase-3 subunit epsilon/ATP-dependent DNA helicase DinG